MRDILDDLLDRSRPAVPVTGSPAFQAAFGDLARGARSVAARPHRRRRAIIGAGLALAIVGGAGAAAASGLFSWSGWASDPDIAYAFMLPSGRACEERILITDGSWQGQTTAAPNVGALTAWARSADFDELIDVPAEVAALNPADGLSIADEAAGRIHPDPAGPDAIMIVLGEDGHLDVVPRATPGPDADSLTAAAVQGALSRLVMDEAARLGIAAATDLAIQCTATP